MYLFLGLAVQVKNMQKFYMIFTTFLHIIEPFYSSKSINLGDGYFNAIMSEINKTDLIIVCLTPENINSPWINFESGLIAGKNKMVIPILLDVNIDTIRHFPLSHYNCIFDIKKICIKL